MYYERREQAKAMKKNGWKNIVPVVWGEDAIQAGASGQEKGLDENNCIKSLTNQKARWLDLRKRVVQSETEERGRDWIRQDLEGQVNHNPPTVLLTVLALITHGINLFKFVKNYWEIDF